MRVDEPARRASLMALAALVTAVAAATTTVLVFELRGQGLFVYADESPIWVAVWRWWTDDLGLFTVSFALGGAGIGFMAALLLLWTTDLSRSIPQVFTVTVLVAAVAANADDPLVGIGASLLCAIAAMAWCRTRFASTPRLPVTR